MSRWRWFVQNTRYMLSALNLLLWDALQIVLDVIYLSHEWSIGKTVRKLRRKYTTKHSPYSSQQQQPASLYPCAPRTRKKNQKWLLLLDDDHYDSSDIIKIIESNMSQLKEFQISMNNLRSRYKHKVKSTSEWTSLSPSAESTHKVHQTPYRKQLDHVSTKINKLFKTLSNLLKQNQNYLLSQIAEEHVQLNYVNIKLEESEQIIHEHFQYLEHKKQSLQQHYPSASITTSTSTPNGDAEPESHPPEDINLRHVLVQIMQENQDRFELIQQHQDDIEDFIVHYESKLHTQQIERIEQIANEQLESHALYQCITNLLCSTFNIESSTTYNPSLEELQCEDNVNAAGYPIGTRYNEEMQDLEDEEAPFCQHADLLMPKTLKNIFFVTQDVGTFSHGVYVGNIGAHYTQLLNDINLDEEDEEDECHPDLDGDQFVVDEPAKKETQFVTEEKDEEEVAVAVEEDEDSENKRNDEFKIEKEHVEDEQYFATRFSTQCKCSIYQLNQGQEHKLFTKSNKWIIEHCGLYLQRNMTLPDFVLERIKNLYNDDGVRNDDNVVIFKCGGTNKKQSKNLAYCSAIILKPTECTHQPASDGYNWKLPSLPRRTLGNQLVYDEYYGLLSIGGQNSCSCYNLSFTPSDQECISEFSASQSRETVRGLSNVAFRSYSIPSFEHHRNGWQWKPLPAMDAKRGFSSCVNLRGEHKVMVIGGQSEDGTPMKQVDIYSFDEMQWSSAGPLKYERFESGCFYDKSHHRIYLGGGCGTNERALKSCEYFDVHKNKWHSLPDTNLQHYNYPILWTENHSQFGGNPQMVYIASIYSNGMECIDLRSNTKKWLKILGEENESMKNNKICNGYQPMRSLPRTGSSSLRNLMGIESTKNKDNYYFYNKLNHSRLLIENYS